LFYTCNNQGTVVHCFTYETEDISYREQRPKKEMSTEYIWETFDGLFKTVHRQERRVEELEARLAELERRLDETRKAEPAQLSELPVERAA
jgi:hypothetical protein